MSMIGEKAALVLKDMEVNGGIAPAAGTGAGNILQIIIGIITGILGSGGLGICKPTPATAHQILTDPTGFQQRRLERMIRRSPLPTGLHAAAYDSLQAIGSALSQDDTDAMLAEAWAA